MMLGDLATYAEQQKKRGRKTSPHTMKRVIQAFAPYRIEVITIALAILLGSLLGLVPAILVSSIFDDAISKGNVTLLFIYVALMAAALVLSGIISLGQAYLNNKVGQNVMYDFRNQLYQHLQSMPLSFFTGTRTGEIQSRLSNDVSGVQGAVTNTATSLVSDITILVSTILAMLVLSPLLTLITLALFPLSGWVTYKVGKIQRHMSKETQESLASLTAQMEETLSVSGILLVKVFGQQTYTQEQFQQANQTLAKLTLRQLIVGRLLSVIIMTVFSLLPILIYLVAGAQIIQHFSVLGGSMTIGTLIAFTTLQYRIFFPLGEITSLQVEFQGSLALFDRIFEYLDLPIEIADKPDALQPEMVRGEVRFSNVTFTYKRDEYGVLTGFDKIDVADDDESPGVGTVLGSSTVGTVPCACLPEEPRLALNNISFTIKPGQLAALVGPSGAGKTTITYMLPRLYDVDSGAVEIDGINVKDIALASLGELIGVVTQETYLFHASIRENLLYARRDATEEEMIAAAQAAAIHERIMELEDGYDTIVGERGYKLSGGEKQRIAIARVILKNPSILILDEATSALDTRSERLIQTALERLMLGRTTLAIAHRLSTILAADIILVVNKGVIVERGTHQELLALGGLYAQLYHEQFSQPSLETTTVGTGLAPVREMVAHTDQTDRNVPLMPTRTGASPVPTIEQPAPTIPHTVPVFKTQISDLQPSQITMQEKEERATSTPNIVPAAPHASNTSSSKVRLKKDTLVPGEADAKAHVLDRNALTMSFLTLPSKKDGEPSIFNLRSRTPVNRQQLVEGIGSRDERIAQWVRQEKLAVGAVLARRRGPAPVGAVQAPAYDLSVGTRQAPAHSLALGWESPPLSGSRFHWTPSLPSAYPHQQASQRVVMDVRSITKSLPLGRERIEILKGISFQIRSGEFVALVGPSGSGKSTLLGIIAGLDNPTSGQVLIGDVDIARLSETDLAQVRNQKIGMVFQAFNLIPTLTAMENVEAPLQVGKRPGPHSARAKELLTLVGLSHRLHHRPNQLSGGEQQRIAIARALATDPPIVIADEPTGNLDARNGEKVLKLIDDLRVKTGKTFIIATHDQNVAAHADRAIRIADGEVSALDTTGGRITQ